MHILAVHILLRIFLVFCPKKEFSGDGRPKAWPSESLNFLPFAKANWVQERVVKTYVTKANKVQPFTTAPLLSSLKALKKGLKDRSKRF